MELDTLEIFAELAVAILGFSGIVAVIGDSTSSRPYIVVRIRGLLLTASVAAVSSIVPLTGLGLSYCSILLVILLLGSAIWGFWLMKQQSANPSWIVFYVSQTAILIGVGWLIVGLAFRPELLVSGYLYSIVSMLLMAGLFFVRMVLAITTESRGT
jgi:hypothetical protein